MEKLKSMWNGLSKKGNKNIVQIPTGFKIANLISNGENKIREQLWNTAQAGKKQPNWKDNRG